MSTPTTPPLEHIQPSRVGLGIALGVAASLAFATSGTFARPLFSAGWTPGATVFWRVAAASVLLLPAGLWVMRGRLRDVLTEWRTVLAFGALGVATAQLMYFAAVDRMSVSWRCCWSTWHRSRWCCWRGRGSDTPRRPSSSAGP